MATKKSGMKKALAVSAGVAAAGALAYGAYKLYGKDGAKNRKVLAKWMKEAQKEIMDKMKEAGDMTAMMSDKMVAAVAKKYATQMGMTKDDAMMFMQEMKKSAVGMLKMMKSKAKKVVKKMPMKKMAKKAMPTKKTAKKAAKKSGKK